MSWSSTSRPSRLAAFALLAALGLPAGIRAQADASADSAQAEAAPTLDELDQKIRILERKLEVKEEQEATQKEQAATVTAGKDGFSLVSADKESVLKFRFFSQADGRAYFEPGDERKLANTLLLRRVRPIWEGTVYKYYNFRVMPEFTSSLSILDAYAELAFTPAARLRVGKSKTPFGLERLKSSADMDLIEFAHPTSLTPNYDVGVSLWGDLFSEALSYSLGVWNGAVDGVNRDADINDDKDVIGRVFALPFKDAAVEPLRGLGVGFAFTWGHKEGDSANTEVPAYRTEGQQTLFSYRGGSRDTAAVRAFGDGWRINPQGYWYHGPFGLFGEYVRATQEYARGGTYLGNVREFTHDAWNATVNWVVTGESPSFKSLKPRHPLGAGGFGALELVARASQIRFDEAAFDKADFASFASAPSGTAVGTVREALTYDIGANWYLSRAAKVSAGYSLTRFEGGTAAGDRPDEKALFGRLQAQF